MTPQRASDRARPVLLRAGTLLLRAGVTVGALTGSVGCAPTTPAAANPGAGPASPASSTAHASQPDDVLAPVRDAATLRTAASLGATPGVEASALAPITDERRPQAELSLDAAIAELLSQPLDARAPEAPARIEIEGEDARLGALQAYAAGRFKLSEGKAAQAVEDLQEAAKIDPGSAEIWRELGNALAAAGRGPAAINAMRRAVALGLREPEVLLVLARESLRQGQPAEAARLLARVVSDGAFQGRPDAALLTTAALGESMVELGYLRAGATLLLQAMETPAILDERSGAREALAELLRRRGELFRVAGDAAARLGDSATADAAYVRAGEVGVLDPASLLSRRVDVAIRAGAAGRAAELLAERLWAQAQSNAQAADDRLIGLIAHVAQDRTLSRALGDSIARMERAGPEAARPTLIRARAAALSRHDPRAARAALLDLWLADVADTGPGLELLDQASPTDVRDLADTLGRALEREPLLTGLVTGVVVSSGRNLREFLAATSRGAGEGSRLLRAGLVSRLLPRDDAAEPLAGAVSLGARAVRVELLAMAGRADEAEAALKEMGEAKTAADRLAVASALRAIQRTSEALAVLEPLLAATRAGDTPDLAPDAASLLRARELGMELALVAGDAPRAVELAERVLAERPAHARAHEVLLAAYGPGGALASQEKVSDVIRRVREADPSSRLLRFIGARELAQRGQWAQAERELTALAEQEPGGAAIFDLLTAVWQRAGETDGGAGLKRGEAWLRAQLEKRPDSIPAAIALTRVLATAGRGDEAEAFARTQLERFENDDLASLRENVLRSVLKREAEADDAALARLEGRRSWTLPAGLELVSLLVRKERWLDAAARLESALPRASQLPDATLAQILSAVQPMISKAAQSREGSALEGASRALATLASRGLLSTGPQYDVWVQLTALADPNNTERILAAVRSYAAALPGQEGSGLARAFTAVSLDRSSRAGLALAKAALPEWAKRERQRVAAPGANAPDLVSQLAGEWLTQIGRVGTNADIEEAIAVLRELGLTVRVARLFSGGLMTIPDGPASAPNPPAEGEIAYAVGNLMHENGRDREANDAYRLALRIHPDHGWAANNLGYFLAEAGENIDEADRLLELAARLLPDEASVIDSLGWLRYLEGQLADRGARLGAVTLLQRAVELSGRLNGTHLDHLGDATWRMGDREGARKLWAEAEALVQMELDERRARAGALGRGNNGEGLEAVSASVRRATEQLEAVRAKVRAARAGQEPTLAPTFAERGIALPAEIRTD
ncbi:MAG: hypothetical protein SFY95_00115 [Planctomycetota bacterium]|nr:hypothetical protein [Planctomycetota bacterium]